MRWTEENGPTKPVPNRKGFGSLVTGPMMESALGGKVEIECGLIWKLTAPVTEALEKSGLADAAAESSRQVRVLIVEDEPLVAADLQTILVDAGFQISGVATRLSKALSLIETVACDVAIVDANLSGSSSGPAAAALAARGLPFIVLSGYTHGQLQSEFFGGSFVQKPYRTVELIDRLRAILPKQ
jgi:CheY-like chemotaxis protein